MVGAKTLVGRSEALVAGIGYAPASTRRPAVIEPLHPGQMLTVPRGVLHRTRPGGARSVNLTCERAGAVTDFVDRSADAP